MRRTLLAVGIAVLLSLLIVPYGNHFGRIEGHYPFVVGGQHGDVELVTPLVLQTVFLVVAAALVANIRWRRWMTKSLVAAVVVALVSLLFVPHWIEHSKTEYVGQFKRWNGYEARFVPEYRTVKSGGHLQWFACWIGKTSEDDYEILWPGFALQNDGRLCARRPDRECSVAAVDMTTVPSVRARLGF